jgi:glycosyltransferase involved in cell wall biosynthesis
MDYQPLISVIIPVYNGQDFLAEAIETVLAEGYQPLEIIIVDDGSTDATATVAQRFTDRIQYYYQENQGPAAARNLGLQLAKGEIYAFLDADDKWVSGIFPQMLDHLMANPKVEIVRGRILQQKIPGQILPPVWAFSTDGFFTHTFYSINMGSALFRRSAFEQVGHFNPSLKQGEDLDWFIRAWELQIEKLDYDQTFLLYRFHAHNLTHNKAQAKSARLHVHKQRMNRFRARATVLENPVNNFLSFEQYMCNGLRKEDY